MNHPSNIKEDRPGYSARLGARLDRSFGKLFAHPDSPHLPSPSSPAMEGSVRLDHSFGNLFAHTDSPRLTSPSSRAMEGSMRFERLRRSRLFALIKGPLLHVRNFLSSPVLSRVDGVQGTLGTHQRLIAQGLERTQATDTIVRQSAEVLEGLQAQVTKLHQSVGLLHAKADDAAIKLRPLVHLKDAYAVPLRDGYLFVPEEEEGLLLIYTGAGPDGLEPGTRRILQMISPAGGTAVDVGASVGLHTLALAHAIGPAGKLHAFEAEPRLEPFLRRTLHANGLHQVELKILAIGAEHREAVFHVARTIGHSSLYALGSPSEVREEVKVQLRPLDELIPKTTKVNVIKIDVEGAELDVIKGAEKTLVRSADCALVAELGPSHLKRVGISLAEWLGAFERFGLKSFAIEEPFGEVKAADPGWLAEQHSVNMLFCRPGSFAHSALLEHKALKSL